MNVCEFTSVHVMSLYDRGLYYSGKYQVRPLPYDIYEDPEPSVPGSVRINDPDR